MLSNLEYSGRLDAEYYRPEYLRSEELLRIRNSKPLSKISEFLIGPFGSAFTVENYTEDKTYRYIRGKDVKQMCLMNDDNVYLPKADFERLSKYALREHDILVSVVGTLGNAAIVEEGDLPAIFSCKSTVLRTNGINPCYLLAYLNSNYGRSLLLRKERGAIQKGLNLDDLRTLAVFVAGNTLQEAIEKIYKKSIEIRKQSESIYSQAEALLLDTLGMKNFSPNADAINIKPFKDSFAATGRLDAEYYQPKYEDFERMVVSHPFGSTTIDAEFELVKETSRREKPAYNYIEIGDVNVGDGAASFNRLDVEELPANAKQEVKRGDLLISKVRPNRGAVAIIDFDDTDLIVSGAFTVLREKESSVFHNETLKVLLRTRIYREWMLKFNIGTQYPVIRDEDILSLPIPRIDEPTQKKIAVLVKESFSLKAESERLLDVAKRAVEIAIEQDESSGIDYIKANS
ncbi:MAG: restriction endonuclease subunit S [Proteobacteria bacterium]|nr:restriction endonuclease subunit S [Pseudomonadota bacterium]